MELINYGNKGFKPMITKEFDKKLFEDNDPTARTAVISYMKRQGHEMIENPDKYDVDLIELREGVAIMAMEVERRPLWSGERFPFDTVHIPLRKKKFGDKYSYLEEFGAIYFIVNKQYTHGMYLHFDDILKCPVVTVRNKYVPNGEQFYDVPAKLFKTVCLKKVKE